MNSPSLALAPNGSSAASIWRAVIVEDEPLDTLHLRRMLKAHPEVEIIGEASSVAAAAELCEEVKPDLIFLDILMANHSGFDLLPKLSRLPIIIFVTAHPQFALRAFEVNAVDYLVKPVYADRLALTLSRLRSESPVESSSTPRSLKREDITLLPMSRNFHVVPTRHISCLRAEANYSTVTLINGKEHLIYRSLQQWENCLPTDAFFRLNRSLIIAPAHLERTKIIDRDMAHLFIKGIEDPIEIGRTTLTRLKKLLATLDY